MFKPPGLINVLTMQKILPSLANLVADTEIHDFIESGSDIRFSQNIV
jgi:hypothetical protein